MIQISKILKEVPIFKMLGKESINFIVERLKFKTFDNNETIFLTGDPGDTMYIIISGSVDILISGPDSSSEQVVATLGPGDYFGEMALLTGETRSASVKTKDSCEMFLLHQNDFDVILERFPSISLSMGKIVSKRLRDTLSKASTLPKDAKLDTKESGPSGSLKDNSLVELISFCESNSLTGELVINHGDDKGIFLYEKGELAGVSLGALKDDQALDKMMHWEDGDFEIIPKKLSFEKKPEKESDIKKILIVNNSLVVRKLIERAFTGLGYNVQTAENIEKSNKLIESSVPDIIITDVKLADGSGMEFCRDVKTVNDVSFIFLSDESIKPEFEEELETIDKAELTKTHEVSEIVKIVENMI
jgi:CRP-like cAMP-binding protein/CheY-like chemotaxis protein